MGEVWQERESVGVFIKDAQWGEDLTLAAEGEWKSFGRVCRNRRHDEIQNSRDVGVKIGTSSSF